MLETIITKEPGRTIIQLSGRIDTLSNKQLEKLIISELQQNKCLLLDFSKVDYVSSAGLRSLMMGHKTATSKGGTMQLCNVGPLVMRVLQSVGFAKLLNIKDITE